MNNKGFTLVELLATIIILGIIMGIATTGVIKTINNSKLKAERIFIERLGDSIKGYLATEGRKLSPMEDTETIEFNKCKEGEDNCFESTLTELESIHLQDLTTSDYKTLNAKDLVNPKNKKNCVENGANPLIRVFKDSEYVYYYYLDLNDELTSCEVSSENAVISNIPKNACNRLKDDSYNDGKCDFTEKDDD